MYSYIIIPFICDTHDQSTDVGYCLWKYQPTSLPTFVPVQMLTIFLHTEGIAQRKSWGPILVIFFYNAEFDIFYKIWAPGSRFI